ncbi:hypothetical protein MNB_ARC-1_864 [hydrothermal vent metagenome]|uniref:Uncharacterized protein n=1 Tax=hydrothermal vent metagenome TaxID=652676 RepID=A0A3B1E587_9ZZZZ
MNLDIENNIEARVLLLGIYKRTEDEVLIDVVKAMANNGVFSLKQGKKYLKDLHGLKLIIDGSLSMIGVQKAKEIEIEFKI